MILIQSPQTGISGFRYNLVRVRIGFMGDPSWAIFVHGFDK